MTAPNVVRHDPARYSGSQDLLLWLRYGPERSYHGYGMTRAEVEQLVAELQRHLEQAGETQ